MSGHSKWSTIKYKKGLKDQKRGRIFSKLVRQIQVAAKNDPNPETNAALRLMVEKAKEANMPSVNIERAIKKASGAGKENQLEEITLEAYGPAGSALLIEAITDNRNRTVAEIKHILERNDGHLAEKGSVIWLFEKKIIFKIPISKWSEEIELSLIDSGLEDSQKKKDSILLLIDPQFEAKAKKILEQAGIEIESEDFDWQAKNSLHLSDKELEQTENLIRLLEDQDDVKAVYNNLD